MVANVARNWSTPVWIYQNVFLTGGAQAQYNFDGDLNDQELHAGAFGQLRSFWNLRVFDIYHPATLDDRLLRGGPIAKRSGYHLVAGGISTDSRRAAVLGFDGHFGRRVGVPGHFFRPNVSIAVKPRTNVFVSFPPSLDLNDDPQQYVTTVTDPTATLFDGNRYVFARLNSKTISFATRMNVTFTPNLTFELFAQPFFSSGKYSAFREFARPPTIDMLVYGRDVGTVTYDAPSAIYTIDPDGGGPASAFEVADPNFSFRSLRGNAVVRWEYRPGSTVFFVWTQQRSGSDAYGDFSFSRERGALFRDRPENVFLVKLNYWLGG